jgi:hypothetical protein
VPLSDVVRRKFRLKKELFKYFAPSEARSPKSNVIAFIHSVDGTGSLSAELHRRSLSKAATARSQLKVDS